MQYVFYFYRKRCRILVGAKADYALFFVRLLMVVIYQTIRSQIINIELEYIDCSQGYLDEDKSDIVHLSYWYRKRAVSFPVFQQLRNQGINFDLACSIPGLEKIFNELYAPSNFIEIKNYGKTVCLPKPFLGYLIGGVSRRRFICIPARYVHTFATVII